MRLVLFAVALCVSGCTVDQAPRPGTSVGNPGKKMVRIAPSEGVELVAAWADSLTVDWIGCGGGYERSATEVEVDLLADDTLDVPGGDWCGLALVFDAPLVVAGEAVEPEASSFEGRMRPAAVVTLWADAPIVVDEHTYVLELGAPDWLNPEVLELEPAGERLFEEDDELARWLAFVVSESSSLYADRDGSGDLDGPERDAGPLAAPTFPPPPEIAGDDELPRVSTEGCGCAGGPAPAGGWLAWVVLLLGLSRTPRRGSRSSLPSRSSTRRRSSRRY